MDTRNAWERGRAADRAGSTSSSASSRNGCASTRRMRRDSDGWELDYAYRSTSVDVFGSVVYEHRSCGWSIILFLCIASSWSYSYAAASGFVERNRQHAKFSGSEV